VLSGLSPRSPLRLAVILTDLGYAYEAAGDRRPPAKPGGTPCRFSMTSATQRQTAPAPSWIWAAVT